MARMLKRVKGERWPHVPDKLIERGDGDGKERDCGRKKQAKEQKMARMMKKQRKIKKEITISL